MAALSFPHGITIGWPADHRESDYCLKNRRTRRESLFKEVIEPIFSETEKIMANYHVIFTKLDIALRSGDEATIRAAAVVFAADRMEMRAVRAKVDSFSEAAKLYAQEHSPERDDGMLKSEMDSFKGFLEAALGVITNRLDHGTASSVALSRLRSYLDEEADNDKAPMGQRFGFRRQREQHERCQLLVSSIAELLDRAEHSWKRTCTLYEQLKLSYALGVDEFVPTSRSKLRFWE